MKKEALIGLLLVLSVFSLSGVLAESCDLQVSMINQDPYPAIQGEYVKLVFQINGISNPECETVEFSLAEKYPLFFDIGQTQTYIIESGTYKKDYSSFYLATYKVRISEDALDGENPIDINYRAGGGETVIEKQFNLEVEDTRADFEIHVKNYNLATRIITFEILNIAESDVEALTIEIPKQDSIEVKGSKVNIVGDLDSNEYTTADFEVIPKEGEIKLNIIYSDTINKRRTIEKTVLFEPEYFEGRIADQKKSRTGTWIIILLIIAGIAWWYFRKRARKKKLAEKRKS
jgi:hypothetical protein